MSRRSRNIRISDEAHEGLRQLGERFGKSITKVVDAIVIPDQEPGLDEFFFGKRRRKK